MKFGIRFLDSISKFPGSNEFRVFFAYSVYICMYYWSFIEQYYWFKAVFCPYIWEFLAMQDAKDTRMHSSRMRTARSLTMMCVFLVGGRCLTWGGLTWGGSALWGGCLTWGVYHVTYPIMHLMLPVCCLHTNWDPRAVQLLIYCWLVMWPARHAGIPPPPPEQNSWHTPLKILPCPKLRLRAAKIIWDVI